MAAGGAARPGAASPRVTPDGAIAGSVGWDGWGGCYPIG
jgi:hypothetical protein